MNILFITPSYTLGGVETQSFHLAKHFVDQGHKVSFTCIRGGEGPLYSKLTEIGVTCHFFNDLSNLNKVGFFGKLKIMFSFSRFIRKIKPTIILPFTEPINTITNVIRPFTGAKKTLYTMRGGYIVPGPQTKFKRLVKFSKPIYVSNSEHGAKLQANYLGVNPDQFKVIRNGIKMNEPDASRQVWREKLGVDLNDKVFVMVANYYSEKKHEVLLSAWSTIQKQNSNAKLVLLGSESPFDRIYFKAKAQILDDKLYDSVVLIDKTDDVSGLLKACDYGVLLTESEGCPNSVLEYMFSELPVVASDIPAIREVLGVDYSYLVNNENIETVISALNSILQKDDFTELVEKNKRIIAESYNYDNLLLEYDKIIL